MAGNKKPEKKKAGAPSYTRRAFLVGSGAAIASTAAFPSTSPAFEKSGYPVSEGYLVYDSKKCAGCTTCMLACSLAHEGVQSLTLSRIQIIQNSFGKFPYDIQMAPCRQCVTPVCVEQCPVGAAHIDTENGNVRRIDTEKCIGCRTCLSACPQQPHRPVWNHMKKKSMKCDLCLDTPYWKEPGGVHGIQACVESCPMKALKLATKTPNQKETEGYDINLRNVHWLNLGLVDSSTVEPPAVAEQPTPFFGQPQTEPETEK
ncbi:MAG: 4Fe-4S dicluster domain-containing protein [Acidobacteriota bacterium]